MRQTGGSRDEPHPGVSIDEAPVGSLLLQVIRAHARVGTRLLQEAGISPPHEIVVLYLDDHGPVPQSELVHYLGRDRSTVTATLQAMERLGLVKRDRSPSDKRAMVVSLTAKGKALVAPIRRAWAELERLTVAPLEPGGQDRLKNALEAIRDALIESR